MVNSAGDQKMKHLFSGSRRFLRLHKRQAVIIGVILLALLAIGLYGAWSVASWRSYEQRSVQSVGNISDSLDRALKIEAADDAARLSKLKVLEETKTRIDNYKAECQPGVLVAWQTSLEPARKQKEACDATAKLLEGLWGDLDKVIQFVRDELSVAAILRPLKTSAELNEAEWHQIRDDWRSAAQKLGEVKVDDQYRRVYETTKERTVAVETAWTELLAAHEAKDRGRFEKAKDELMKAYGAFKAAAEDTDDNFRDLEQKLADSYRSAF